MFTNKTKIAKWIGLFGAVASGVALTVNGQVQEGVGVIFAAFSSANLS